MKITEMIAREDFYAINEKTLKSYYGKKGKDTYLYVYPKLNAIVVRNPYKQVVDYLLTEYSVRSALKRIATKGYVMTCLKSRGFLAEKKLTINGEISSDTLIYPCNKKYRIFNFNANTVSVIIKDGFDDRDLKHEIEFRKRKDNPHFVPRLIQCSEKGYTEQIIDGKPVARISDTDRYGMLKGRAYNELRSFYKSQDKTVNGEEYTRHLESQIKELCKEKYYRSDVLNYVVDFLAKHSIKDVLILGFSHGDLQPGNIWISNADNKIFIIDWESWGTRSIFYDYATLFEGLRPGSIKNYLLGNNKTIEEKSVVLLEDIIFQLQEYNSLPGDFGKGRIDDYLNAIKEWLSQQ